MYGRIKQKNREKNKDKDEQAAAEKQEEAAEQEEEMETSSEEQSDKPKLTLGIIPAPEAASDISNQLASALTKLLPEYVDNEYSWEVDIVVDSYIGVEQDAGKTLEQAETIADEKGWDFTIAITDMPLFKEGEFLVAEVDDTRPIAQISFPALGIYPLYRRVCEASLQLVSEMHHGVSEEDRDEEQRRIDGIRDSHNEKLTRAGSRELISRGPQKHLTPITRKTGKEETDENKEKESRGSVRFIASPIWNGYFRVATGMVRANDPWKVVLTFKSIVAIAFATGAYALIFPTVWTLADHYDFWRAVLLMVISTSAMTFWIIATHQLWERTADAPDKPHLIWLHNISTMFTIVLGVFVYYWVLFAAFLATVFLFIPVDMLESSEGLGRPVEFQYYFYLAWLMTSLATVIGAIGAGLEDEETVLKGTYGYRQRKRKEALREKKKKQEEEEES
ncbi:hypothetical protein [Alkalicoccus urumqiensis]|uniref:5,10-methylene-tetrahydrofolate dehydrogenase n=1 Tax=Alkalicoccus urumqiensis TaxID=1548213 RepID=A0A2P6MJS0_ALKUR|nr:hypothetical protein [Alkalicoccus urumqiensis]PRO66536.1 hypothetical protein C6I21_04115 [Alkalicoccus urumqiensis]